MKTCTVIIETPKGSAQKYDYDPKLNGYCLGKLMPTGMIFPYDFGFIPKTKGQDGDPLDVIVLSELKSFPGCVMKCRIVGVITAKQESQKGMIRNDRFIGIPELSLVFSEIKNVSDLPEKLMNELQDFFINYNKIENKKFKPLGILNAAKAAKLIDL